MKNVLIPTALRVFLIASCTGLAAKCLGQGIGINSSGNAPHASSILDLNASPTFDKGLLVPRMSTPDRNSIPSPAAGLVIFNLSSGRLNYFNGSFWREVESAISSPVFNPGAGSAGPGVVISDAPATPESSALLDIISSGTPRRGLLLPRTTGASISSPASGLLIFDPAGTVQFFDGTSWRTLCNSGNVPGAPGIQTADGVAINLDGSPPDPSAILDVKSTTAGLLIPRLTSAQRDALPSPATGLILYNSTDNRVEFFDGTNWHYCLYSAPAAASAQASPLPACSGSSLSLTGSAQNASSWLWTGPNGFSSSAQSPVIGTVDPSSAGTYNLTASNACGSASAQVEVTVSSGPAQPGNITGSAEVCRNNNGVAYSVPSSPGVSYNWSFTGTGLTVASGQNTSSILANFSASATSGNLTVTPSTSCGSGTPQILSITVTPAAPSQPSAVTGNAIVCRGNTGVPYSVTATAGVTYTWTYSGTGFTVASGQGSASITANFSASATSGTLTCTPSNVCGNGTARTLAITVLTAAPAQPSAITGSTVVCPNVNGIAYSVTNVPGTTYTWTYSGAGFSVATGQGTNAITANFDNSATSGTLTVTPSNACGNGTARTQSITVGGGLIASFGTNGVVTQDFSSTSDRINAMAADATGIYVAGYDWAPGNYQMRVQKRNLTTGALIWNQVSNPTTNSDQINAIAVDASGVYVAGFDMLGGSDYEWRIEKRDLGTGALVNGFGTGGVVTQNKSASNGFDWIIAMTIDATGLYFAGIDIASGNEQWRIEKRDLTTGAILWTQGSNPTTGSDRPTAMAVDASGVYIVGYDAQQRARIEKRNLTTGALVAAFGTSGVVTVDLSADDAFYAVTLDATGLYVAGYDNINGSEQWRIEKRNLTTGALDAGFGSGGVVTSNYSAWADRILAITLDANSLYVGGYNSITNSSTFQWRAEKRSLTTGAVQWSQVGTASISHAVHAIVQDASGVYAAGRGILSSNNEQWKIEKYCK